MAWTVEDCALLLQAMAGPHAFPTDRPSPAGSPAPISAGDLKGLRIGAVRHFYEADHPADAGTREAIERALVVFRELGAHVRDISLAPLADYAAAGGVIMICEAYQQNRETLRQRPEAFGRIFRNRISAGMLYDAEDLERAYSAARRLRAEFFEQIEDVDVVVTAIAPAPAPPIDAVPMWPSVEKPSLATPFNITRGPALAVCCGYSQSGLPLSMQIAGRAFADALVMRVGHAYEQATAWRSMRPAIVLAHANKPQNKNMIGAECGC